MARKKTSAKNRPSSNGRWSSGRTSKPGRSAPADARQPEAAPRSAAPGRPGITIAGIGASAGGLEALEELFEHMPADTGMAFVVVTHQHPGHTSLLPELLGKRTAMPVAEAKDGLAVKPNCVYVGPPGGHLAILHGTLHLMKTGRLEAPKLPIDYFFRSLAEDRKERAVCIVLSGTGTDGTLGLKAIKGESGMAMVEQPQSAKYSGMPASAIATGLADYVLPPAEMARHLIAYVNGPYLAEEHVSAEVALVPAEPLQKIFVLLRSRTGHDFSAYKSNTIRRRIERRMNVHQIEKPNQYVRYLEENPHEIDVLFKELLISVTSFFRDPEAWEALVPHLTDWIRSRPEGYIIRAWVPGCATGEEAYSLAILLRECMEHVNKRLDVQLFGTDLDPQAVETARAGRYPDGIAVDVSPKRLERFFNREDGSYRIRKEIREMAIFALQSVTKDPPFTNLDLVSCRNLLIYLNADLQRVILPIFHYALKPGGILFLGTSETAGSANDLFEPLDKRWKFFRRRENTAGTQALPHIPLNARRSDDRPGTPNAAVPSVQEVHFSARIEQFLLNRFAPASVVVSERGDIVYIHGRTGAYLEPARGTPRHNVLEMAREGLQLELGMAIREALTKNAEVVRENIRVKTNGDFVHVDLSVAKMQEPEAVRGLLLLTFRPTAPPLPSAARARKAARSARGAADGAGRLQRELQFLKESNQTALEELETSNEELKSTNEELQSTNEELQSTNEELETSKEELQSLNEELTTVNTELQSKVEELSQANDDMQNLLNSTEIATVFLDNDLNIKRFTEQAKDLIRLRPTDVGRPISELTSNFKLESLAAYCRQVLRTLVVKEAEVESNDGRFYLMRILPYRTAENAIDGLVLTFVSFRRSRLAELTEKMERAFFLSIVETVRGPLVVLDKNLRIVFSNDAFLKISEVMAQDIQGLLLYELAGGQWDHPRLRELLEEILPQDSKFEGFELQLNVPDGRREFLLNARRLKQPEGVADLILLALEEVKP